MSQTAEAYVATLQELTLSQSERDVLKALALLAAEDQHQIPLVEHTVAAIAAQARRHPATVKSALNKLVLRTVRYATGEDGPLVMRTAQYADDGAQLRNLYCFPALGVPGRMRFSVHYQQNRAKYERLAQTHRQIDRQVQAYWRRRTGDTSATS